MCAMVSERYAMMGKELIHSATVGDLQLMQRSKRFKMAAADGGEKLFFN